MSKEIFEDKKGMFGDLQGMIMSLIIIGVVIGLGFLVLSQFQTQTITTTGTSESWTGTNVTNYSFLQRVGYPSSLLVKASGVILTSTNYTVYNSNGYLDKIILTDTSPYIGNVLSLDFNYKDTSGTAYIGINKTIGAMETIPQWLGIIVLLGIVAILLGILFRVFPTKTNKDEQTFI